MNWITADKLRHKRIDAPYYSPVHLETEKQILKAHEYTDFVELADISYLWSGPFGSKLPSSLYHEVGPYPLYRSQNVKPFWVQEEGLVYLDHDAFEDLKGYRALQGDILVSKAGFVGTACVIQPDEGPGIITEHVLGIRPIDDEETYYLLTAINSSICKKQLEREGLGTILSYLGVDVTRELLIPYPPKEVRTSIGNKVRAGERLKNLAISKMEQLKSIFPELPETINGNSIRWIAQNDMDSGRIEAEYYNIAYILALDQLREYCTEIRSLGEITKSMRHGGNVPNDYSASGNTRLIRGLEILPNRISRDEKVFLSRAAIRGLSDAHYAIEDDILITRSGTVGVCAVVGDEENDSAFGSFIIAVQLEDGIEPEYVCAFLNSPLGQIQFRREENGAVQLNINNEELARIKVPILPAETRKTVVTAIRLINEYADRSETLVSEAIRLVENLIEGNLDIDECLSQGRELAEEFGLERP
jgi:type I restriction enzyme, S subunit